MEKVIIMNLDPEVIAKVAGPVISILIGAVLKHYTEARSKVISFVGHASAFTIKGENPVTIHTHSIVISNTGRKAATNVRLTHANLPANVVVYPPVKYLIERNPVSQLNPEGAGEIIFPVLVPKEQVTISYLYAPPLTWSQINVNTKSDEGFAKIINAIPMPQSNKVILFGTWILSFIGASFLFYWLVRLGIAII